MNQDKRLTLMLLLCNDGYNRVSQRESMGACKALSHTTLGSVSIHVAPTPARRRYFLVVISW